MDPACRVHGFTLEMRVLAAEWWNGARLEDLTRWQLEDLRANCRS
jgi:hypothetical protein